MTGRYSFVRVSRRGRWHLVRFDQIGRRVTLCGLLFSTSDQRSDDVHEGFCLTCVLASE